MKHPVLLLLLCVSLIQSGCRDSDPANADKTSTSPAEKSPVGNDSNTGNEKRVPLKRFTFYDGTTRKLPANWERTSYGGEGEIHFENGVIGMEIGSGLTGINWKVDKYPTNNFKMIVRARRIVGEDMTCGLTFPVGDQFASLIVGGWGGSVVGISCVDGKAANENKTTSDMQFIHKQWYTVEVVVRGNRLTCSVDDRKVVEIDTTGHKFSLRGGCEPSQPFAVFTFATCIEVDRIEIIDLSGKQTSVD